MSDEERDQAAVPYDVEWWVADDTVTLLATNLVIQHGPGVFVLNFFDTQLPIDVQEQAGAPPKLVAKCVARVGVPAPALRSFVRAIEDNLAKYERRYGPSGDERMGTPEGVEQ